MPNEREAPTRGFTRVHIFILDILAILGIWQDDLQYVHPRWIAK